MTYTSVKSLDTFAGSTLRPLRLLWTLSSYLLFAAGSGVLSWLILPVVWCLGGSLAERCRRCQSAVSAALRFFHWYMRLGGLIDFEPNRVSAELLELAEPGHGPVVIIANHPTLVDTTALLASVKHLCCISKPGFYRNPLLYPLVLFCGHINTGNAGIGSSVAVVRTAVARLKAGHSLLIFPEGTRSPSHGLGPFRRGAFEIALRAGAPVQPVVIEVSRPVLNRELPWYWMPNESVQYTVSALPKIPALDAPPNARVSHELCEAARKEYAARLGLS